ncbi:MAG: NUDIX domain-containing protein [Pseudomonadota bacterium]
MTIAAGGILEKQTKEGLKIAVVYRERHGSEWSLPKGKVEPGESLEKAALREVFEETHCSAVIKRYAGATDYMVDAEPKVIFFWVMTLETENPFQASEETKQLLWLSPKEAMNRLTHQNQREILEKAYPEKRMNQKGSLILFYIKRTKRWNRLASSIQSYRNEINCLEKLVSPECKCTNCFDTARNLLDEAQERLDSGFVDWGWKLFHAARRMELISLCSEDQRRTNARLMLQEGGKIKGWRGEAIKRLIEFEKEPPTVEALFQAALTRDEYFNNNAYKIGLLQTQAIVLAFILAMVLAAFFVWLKRVPATLPPLSGISMDPFQFLITSGLFGILGGVLSATTSVPKSLDASRIPEITTAFQVTFLRLFMGFASAIVIIIVIHSHLAGNVLSGVFSYDLAEVIKKAEPYSSYFIAFCAGFSERLVRRAVEYVAGK